MARRSKNDNIIVGLDIGTTKICSIVGELIENRLEIIGVGTHPSTGLRKGVVVNIESTVESIKKSIEEAELMAGCNITSVYTGIAGGHIKGLNSHGIIAIKSREVTPADVKRVIEAASAISIPMDREVIHILPQEFIIDDQDGISNPVGMSGVRLEVKVHIVTGAVASAQNIIKCVNRTGVDVDDIVLEQLASSKAVLSEDEKELGVALLDIGGGTTDIAIFSGGSIKYTSVIALGGNHVTNDIAFGLRTPIADAEKIKVQNGCSYAAMVGRDEMIEVPNIGTNKPRMIPKRVLAEIIEPRMQEIFSLANREILKSGYEDLIAAGVVVTGGSSMVEGIPELAEQVFEMSVRRGTPLNVGGLTDIVDNPMYATGVGLVNYGWKHGDAGQGKFKNHENNIFSKVTQRMKQWIKEFF
ncbi:cell division protein FtsA [Thermodesulfobacteriota bacterium]